MPTPTQALDLTAKPQTLGQRESIEMLPTRVGASARCMTCGCEADRDAWLDEILVRWAESGRLERTSVIIWHFGPSGEAIKGLGFSPTINPMDGSRYGEPAFRPFWRSLRNHGGWFELEVSFCDADFSVVLLIKDWGGTDRLLREMCHQFAE